MLRTPCYWTVALSITLLPAAAGQAPVEPKSAPAATPAAPALEKKLDDLAGYLRVLAEVVEKLRTAHEKLDLAAKETADLRKQIADLTSEMSLLRNEVSQLRSTVAQAAPRRPESVTAEKPVQPTLGTVQLINAYLTPVMVYLDGEAILLQPNEVRNVQRAPGAFTYSIPGVQPNRVQTVAAGETLTIRVVVR